MTFLLDKPAVMTALRTAGALMLGNVFIAVLLLGNRNWLTLIALFVLGLAVILLCSTTARKD